MKSTPITRRAGMTLVELLVVIMIIGLLSVAVLPSLNRNPDGKRILNAAEIVSSHLNQQMSRALGSANGSATWYGAESTGAGSGLAVIGLRTGRPQTTVSGSAWITVSGSVSPPFTPQIADLLPAPIQFAGIPAEFTATKTPFHQVVVDDSTTNRTSWNLSLPVATANPLPYVLSLPPRKRLQVSTPMLQNNTCIDLNGSTIGVYDFSANQPVSLADSSTLSIEFEKSGRPVAAWRQLAASGDWRRTLLSATTPVALLIGLRSQIGATVVPTPTQNEPGANCQNPAALWVVLDPRTSAVRIVENSASINVRGAQAYVLQTLRGL
jgi:prepilin-type N-terminal cleavage/methylation domain-containing protein